MGCSSVETSSCRTHSHLSGELVLAIVWLGETIQVFFLTWSLIFSLQYFHMNGHIPEQEYFHEITCICLKGLQCFQHCWTEVWVWSIQAGQAVPNAPLRCVSALPYPVSLVDPQSRHSARIRDVWGPGQSTSGRPLSVVCSGENPLRLRDLLCEAPLGLLCKLWTMAISPVT